MCCNHFLTRRCFTTLYNQICDEYKRLEHQIKFLETQIKTLPKGALICAKNGNYFKWYKRDGTKLSYLKKKNLKLAEELALKKYYSLQLQDLLHEKIAINMYLKHHQQNVNKASRLLSDTSGYLALLTNHFTDYSKELKEWVNAPYEKNNKYPEQLIHKSISGNIVRSKSEALIDMALYQNQIPYRYENPLILNDITIYPDFTLRHPKTGQLLYWEHFGMMDNPNYSKNACNKLQLYSSNGLIPSFHVITTFESEECPLTSVLIGKIIEYYFM